MARTTFQACNLPSMLCDLLFLLFFHGSSYCLFETMIPKRSRLPLRCPSFKSVILILQFLHQKMRNLLAQNQCKLIWELFSHPPWASVRMQ